MQTRLIGDGRNVKVAPFAVGLLKWVGNKQRVAHGIVSYFPPALGAYFVPFLGSAAVLETLQPGRAIGSDAFSPLVEIWRTVREDSARLKRWSRRGSQAILSLRGAWLNNQGENLWFQRPLAA